MKNALWMNRQTNPHIEILFYFSPFLFMMDHFAPNAFLRSTPGLRGHGCTFGLGPRGKRFRINGRIPYIQPSVASVLLTDYKITTGNVFIMITKVLYTGRQEVACHLTLRSEIFTTRSSPTVYGGRRLGFEFSQ